MRKLHYIIIMIIISTIFSFSLHSDTEVKQNEPEIKVLILLGEWFGDAYFPLKDEIEQRGWCMKRIGIAGEYRGCYNKARDVVLTSEIVIKNFKDYSSWDCLIIPSGPQFRKFSKNESVLQFIRDWHEHDGLIFSFCVGNILVGNSGLVPYKNYSDLFPDKITEVKEGIIFGPRGGGPPPGNGLKGVDYKKICDAIEEEIRSRRNH